MKYWWWTTEACLNYKLILELLDQETLQKDH